MIEKIDCFLPCDDIGAFDCLLDELRGSQAVRHIHLLVAPSFGGLVPTDCHAMRCLRPLSAATMLQVAASTDAEYALLSLKPTPFRLGQNALERLVRVADDTGAVMVYSDHLSVEKGVAVPHPVIDYQVGSIRDDFDFGQLVLVRASCLHEWASSRRTGGRDGEEQAVPDLQYAGWYALRLFLSRKGCLFHLNESLYTEQEMDTRLSGEKQFDYVNPRHRDVQVEMEQVATRHLEAIGAKIDTTYYHKPDFGEQVFDYEASVVIPVFNREKTIADAVKSALGQKTSFKYNVIVVDNHSTDGTTAILRDLANRTDKLVHIIPSRTDLGIGGCWNVAVGDGRCGRFAVQLDSDDLYSSPHTLQQVVDAFYKQQAAMVIGSYRMCDFNLDTLPPGLIDHREWTDANGCNNALRVNGLGAPRAFFTPLLRQLQFPNTSYGEDYAVGLAFSRRYRIGRIFSELYLCRRWDGNSDHALDIARVNANNLYKDRLRTMEILARQQMVRGEADATADSSVRRFFNRQLEVWDAVRKRYQELRHVETKTLAADDQPAPFELKVQYNPARMVSTGARVDKSAIARRSCFLCDKNLPKEQLAKPVDDRFQLLVNPYPVLPMHFTVPARRHQPQAILDNYGEMHKLLTLYPDLLVFYNGPRCGASAPDHMHFQAGTSELLPLQACWPRLARNLKVVLSLNADENVAVLSGYPCPAFVIRSKSVESDVEMFRLLYHAMDAPAGEEPMLNVVAWRDDDTFLSVVFPRRKHRPDCYYATGDAQMLISPGALDMAGLTITPRKEDFDRITYPRLAAILREMAVTDDDMRLIVERLKEPGKARGTLAGRLDPALTGREPDVHVGIVSGERMSFTLNSGYQAKGESVIGRQEVAFAEGGILWKGNQYRELTFHPQRADASFSLDDVTIGVGFHWERKETQTFLGTLRFVVEEDKICAINVLPVERYLESVISSEMSATASLELLKAHAVISRSWLLAQMEKRRRLADGSDSFFSFTRKDDELVRWYDREDHTIFDVCADDHCQRYQGITRETDRHVAEAVAATRGEILTADGDICDARFSKCCGGMTEEFQYCWENIRKPYLVATRDLMASGEGGLKAAEPSPLTVEGNAVRWIRSCPDSFCNTRDPKVLRQVLNDYDRETPDFYRWKVEYAQDELSAIIADKLKMDLGRIVDLVPLERGTSGRIARLKIVGTKKTFTIGKELEIRRALSPTHLYSSAFVADRLDIGADGVPARFLLTGAGWGHGVGLCQIGAAVMGEKGYRYGDILLHYYHGAAIEKIYK